ncbi:hypothetical protein E3V36_07350 [Candidatus Marinimicrobia bacterium MT.SAG.2]|nr:hypothetical protein E3V36_07350 [Candidatus Marinimicrobia bacterium MT.SAG.2]
MRPRKYTTEKIIIKLREAEVLISQGMDAYEASRQIGVSRQTFNRWRKEYGEMPAENHQVTWDGSKMASGIYFYRLQAGDFVQTRKMVLLK